MHGWLLRWLRCWRSWLGAGLRMADPKVSLKCSGELHGIGYGEMCAGSKDGCRRTAEQCGCACHRRPVWLAGLIVRRGQPGHHVDNGRTRQEWTWDHGDVGVVVQQHSRAWQVLVFSPVRSVSLRTPEEPSPGDMSGAVALAGLDDVVPDG